MSNFPVKAVCICSECDEEFTFMIQKSELNEHKEYEIICPYCDHSEVTDTKFCPTKFNMTIINQPTSTCGYLWEGMIKISYEEAVKRFSGDEVYLLYSDQTESLVCELAEIEGHESNGGEFGYERITKC